jgi:hypothetical protein
MDVFVLRVPSLSRSGSSLSPAHATAAIDRQKRNQRNTGDRGTDTADEATTARVSGNTPRQVFDNIIEFASVRHFLCSICFDWLIIFSGANGAWFTSRAAEYCAP